jgi:hypothetical protein
MIADLLTFINNLTGLPALYWPNISAPVPTGNHARVDVLPVPTESMGVSGPEWQRGIVQFTVMVRDGTGAVGADAIAETIISKFPRGTSFSSSGLSIRFDEKGWKSPGSASGGWYQVPVTIPYNYLT